MNKAICIIFCFAVSIFFAGCGDSTKTLSEKKIFHYNQSSGISSLDPAFSKDQATIWACNQLYNGLVQLDDGLNTQPAIAKRWEISADGLVYTFHLRNDVFFQEDACFSNKTRKVTAQDVVYSLARIRNSRTASPGAWIFNGRVDTLEPFKAINDSTFQLKLLHPFRPMLGILTMPYCSIIPEEAVKKYGLDFRAHPVGTGPFKLKIWRENVALIMVKNESYFEEDGDQQLPYLDGIRISFIDNKKSEFFAFKQGNLDFISGLDASYIDDVVEKDGTLKSALKQQFDLNKTPYLNTEYLGFLMQSEDSKNPVLDKRVRLAINYGFDRKELIRYLRNGIGRPAESGFAPYGLPSFDSTLVGYSFNPEKAKALLKDAGYSAAHPLPEIKLYTNETYKEMALFVSKQLEKIGVTVKLEINQGAILREWMSQGKAPFFRGSWIADYPDAENYYTVFYSKNGSPPNYTRFHNAAYDALYEKALTENEDAKRYELYQQMEKILIEESPVVPLFYDEVLRFSQKHVKGLTPNALNLLNLKRVKIED
jgi:peptide/nickel transport system substrate-binding protein